MCGGLVLLETHTQSSSMWNSNECLSFFEELVSNDLRLRLERRMKGIVSFPAGSGRKRRQKAIFVFYMGVSSISLPSWETRSSTRKREEVFCDVFWCEIIKLLSALLSSRFPFEHFCSLKFWFCFLEVLLLMLLGVCFLHGGQIGDQVTRTVTFAGSEESGWLRPQHNPFL